MSQPSKPATAYFKAAVKVLRLQRALSRSKSSKSSKDSVSPANSTPCSSTTPSFQHTNGKRVTYLHYHHHNQSHHGHHYRSESFDTPLYALQRRRHTNGSHNHTTAISSTGQYSSAASVSHKHACKEVILYSSALPSTPKKHSRRSASPATFPAFSIHHSQQQQHQHQQQSSNSSLSRSKSMPNRRLKRASLQVVVVPQHLDIWVAGLASSSSAYDSNACLPRRSLSVRSRASTVSMSSAPPSPALSPQQELEDDEEGKENKNGEETALSDTCEGVVQAEVLDRAFERIPNPTVSDSGPTRIDATSAALQRSNAFKAPMVSQQASRQDQQDQVGEIPTGGSPRKTVPGSRPSRSFTGSSLSSASSVFSTAMPLADSSMSIQSQRSESSLLSAVISAGGLPSMDVMMDQVDRSIAADRQAQLVENAHVGLACVSVVDRNLLAEPCSAEIETWVS